MNHEEKERLSQQCYDVLDYVWAHEFITHRIAEDELGVTRLAARICDLKKHGYLFEHKWVSFTARNGRKGRFMSYKYLGKKVA